MNTNYILIKIEKDLKNSIFMATHNICKFRLTKTVHKDQIKLLKQQLLDKTPQESQSNNSQYVLTNLTQQLQKLNSQNLKKNSIFDEIKLQKPLKYNKYATLTSKNYDQSLTTILRKLQQSIPKQNEIKDKTQNYKKEVQPINNTIQTNEGTIKVDYQF
ncbi:unnamed protein product (macronuclear) [Paramecium tetraurelia]|uniref:Uncharacterized protein n=1 Tax=Paramecium tetraurelia TaxID=5888 RepID=A0CVQ3_PARTE|nr:uncharacterized protein GSPATT00011038001 [Paramecium tetraurelia]CAK74870.1 unnamed protein product [Paramecium tetraurelia]|eukprot:XP_001442267.1 hypothetical protein (macronuclear) [Paramecium tetraurelia strain d4-2]